MCERNVLNELLGRNIRYFGTLHVGFRRFFRIPSLWGKKRKKIPRAILQAFEIEEVACTRVNALVLALCEEGYFEFLMASGVDRSV